MEAAAARPPVAEWSGAGSSDLAQDHPHAEEPLVLHRLRAGLE
eukprot:COSAG01_NODE_3811_length_5675_cov_6.241930_1_plen_42_part_10